ncbi:hypothetical protein [Chitinimonas sp.]|uniref:hypothetical protein n=1 Tax=Chitinimonas sp. TaxID=1934313 RepID=UPI002F924356
MSLNVAAKLLPLVFFLTSAVLPISVLAADADFSGRWFIDLRSKEERKAKVECGSAEFYLVQKGKKITGQHTFATPQCGRMNDSEEETVKGEVIGSTAILTVTSGRNGAVVRGKAVLQKGALHWQVLEEIKAGDVEGDSALILEKGILVRK